MNKLFYRFIYLLIWFMSIAALIGFGLSVYNLLSGNYHSHPF
ncbi:hypothetical protein [Mucilaginibacter flavus]|nr:hypothetical protein [Mucilaginibacter flavus]